MAGPDNISNSNTWVTGVVPKEKLDSKEKARQLTPIDEAINKLGIDIVNKFSTLSFFQKVQNFFGFRKFVSIKNEISAEIFVQVNNKQFKQIKEIYILKSGIFQPAKIDLFLKKNIIKDSLDHVSSLIKQGNAHKEFFSLGQLNNFAKEIQEKKNELNEFLGALQKHDPLNPSVQVILEKNNELKNLSEEIKRIVSTKADQLAPSFKELSDYDSVSTELIAKAKKFASQIKLPNNVESENLKYELDQINKKINDFEKELEQLSSNFKSNEVEKKLDDLELEGDQRAEIYSYLKTGLKGEVKEVFSDIRMKIKALSEAFELNKTRESRKNELEKQPAGKILSCADDYALPNALLKNKKIGDSILVELNDASSRSKNYFIYVKVGENEYKYENLKNLFVIERKSEFTGRKNKDGEDIYKYETIVNEEVKKLVENVIKEKNASPEQLAQLVSIFKENIK